MGEAVPHGSSFSIEAPPCPNNECFQPYTSVMFQRKFFHHGVGAGSDEGRVGIRFRIATS